MTGVTALAARLARDRGGASLVEFALALPLVMGMGGYGVELSNKAIVGMRVSQIALSLADNASRIGVSNGSAVYQLREGDLNDILSGAQLMGDSMKLTTYGRVTVSSLENIQRSYDNGTSDSAAVQRIHWQRCTGKMSGVGTAVVPVYDSSYGQALPLASAGTDGTASTAGSTSTGMGSTPKVQAPSGSGVIFVEINYQYQPLFGTMFASKTLVHAVASFIVRDRRDFSRIFNPATALGTTPARMTCDKYAA